jgi:hypothetical protein
MAPHAIESLGVPIAETPRNGETCAGRSPLRQRRDFSCVADAELRSCAPNPSLIRAGYDLLLSCGDVIPDTRDEWASDRNHAASSSRFLLILPVPRQPSTATPMLGRRRTSPPAVITVAASHDHRHWAPPRAPRHPSRPGRGATSRRP